MNQYEIVLKHDGGKKVFRVGAINIHRAKQILLDAERAPMSAIETWRVIPTAKQIKKTQNMMRNL
jgi:hypothetical protein